MTTKEAFVLAVQAGAIVRDIRMERDLAAAVVGDACAIPEERIDAALEAHNATVGSLAQWYVRWQYGLSSDAPKGLK